jgi:anaerobic ribonucleoside-triphosphate reductase activating protein
VTGGEPFEQPSEVTEVIHGVRDRVGSARRSASDRSCDPEIDVLVFTGFPTRVARRRAPQLFAAADALVCGRYDPRQPAGGPLLATANQELVITSELGAQRFNDLSNQPSLQVAAINGDLMIVGIPRAGDLDRVAVELGRHGIAFEGVTWH